MDDLMMAFPLDDERRARVLVRSLRVFGGELAGCPVWAMIAPGQEPISDTAQAELADLGVRLVPFETDPDALAFSLAGKVYAAAAAEEEAAGHTRRLAWLDIDTLFIQEPSALLTSESVQLAYCPVHHRLIGSLYDAPLDDFWALVYERCEVPAERVFSMQTIVDEATIRSYINAGHLVVPPDLSLLAAWRAQFEALYRDPAFVAFYERHALYQVFVHQAILVGVLLARLDPAAMQELPRNYNYPLHLYDDHDAARRPAAINELVTCRYESVFDTAGWGERLPITGRLKTWLAEQFGTT